jgi:hypothetical protein
VCGEDRVVRLDDGAGKLRRGVHAELQFRLLPVVCRQTFKEKRAETRSSSSTKGVEHKEALQTRAVVSQTTELVHHGIDELLSNGVMTTRIWKAMRFMHKCSDVIEVAGADSQLFAASSLPVIMVSGWKRDL